MNLKIAYLWLGHLNICLQPRQLCFQHTNQIPGHAFRADQSDFKLPDQGITPLLLDSLPQDSLLINSVSNALRKCAVLMERRDEQLPRGSYFYKEAIRMVCLVLRMADELHILYAMLLPIVRT